MLASYAVILRRSAVITAPAALVMVVLSAILGGVKGLVGALLGAGLVAVFFGISALVITGVGRRRPGAAMGVAAAAYVVKIIVLVFVVARFATTTAFNGKIFGLTAIACVLVWTGSQALTSMRLKVLYVEPEQAGEPDAAAGALAPPQADPGTPGARYAGSGGER